MNQIYKQRGKLTAAPAAEAHQPDGPPDGPTDDELVGSATRGDERAFDELVARHRPMIFRVVRRFFQRHDEIEELAQLSLVQAWFAIGS